MLRDAMHTRYHDPDTANEFDYEQEENEDHALSGKVKSKEADSSKNGNNRDDGPA